MLRLIAIAAALFATGCSSGHQAIVLDSGGDTVPFSATESDAIGAIAASEFPELKASTPKQIPARTDAYLIDASTKQVAKVRLKSSGDEGWVRKSHIRFRDGRPPLAD